MIDIAICDDNRDDLNMVAKMIEEILLERKIVFNLHMFVSAKKMLEEIKKVDIGILDISMDEINGIELGRKIKLKFSNAKLLYVTSFNEYCQQAINDVHAFSFLSKPINKEKLQKQIDEVVNDKLVIKNTKDRTFYNLKDENGKEYLAKKVNLDNIIYFEYVKSKRRILMIQNEGKYEFSYVMDKLAKEMGKYEFVVCCRGCLINLQHVSKVKGYSIYLDNGDIVPLSQKRVSNFKGRLNRYLSNSF